MPNNNLLWAIESNAYKAFVAKTFGKISAQDEASIAQSQGLPVKVLRNVAIIKIVGVMLKNPSFIDRLFGATSTTEIKEAVISATKDQAIDTIILQINSPGGQVAGIMELSDSIAKAKESNNVIAVCDGSCASAAYWVASQANKIYVSGMHDMVGSIGVRMEIIDSSAAYEKAGLKVISITTGKFKAAGVSGLEVTEEQIAEFQKVTDILFDDFVLAVATGRHANIDEVLTVADGRMFMAKDAADKGLIDGIKVISQVINESVLSEPANVGFRVKARAKVAIAKLSKGNIHG